MGKKRANYAKLSLLKQWDDVCKPLRQRYEETKRIEIEDKIEDKIIRTSSGYSRTKIKEEDKNVW